MKIQRLVGIAVLLFPLIFFGVMWTLRILLNTTDSLPHGLYRISEKFESSTGKGKLVVITPVDSFAEAKERGYLPRNIVYGYAPLLKKVVATAGDTVEVDNEVRVNGITLKNSTPRSYDRAGRPLTPYRGKFVVPSNYIFVLNDYTPYSYDSRYFGPVPVSAVRGVAKPFLIFE